VQRAGSPLGVQLHVAHVALGELCGAVHQELLLPRRRRLEAAGAGGHRLKQPSSFRCGLRLQGQQVQDLRGRPEQAARRQAQEVRWAPHRPQPRDPRQVPERRSGALRRGLHHGRQPGHGRRRLRQGLGRGRHHVDAAQPLADAAHRGQHRGGRLAWRALAHDAPRRLAGPAVEVDGRGRLGRLPCRHRRHVRRRDASLWVLVRKEGERSCRYSLGAAAPATPANWPVSS